MNMIHKNFDYHSLPVHFAYCLNDRCGRAATCLRHLAVGQIPNDRALLTVINPAHVAPDGAQCTSYIDQEPQLFARGMVHLLDKVPHAVASHIKNALVGYFGRTVYYRCRNKERLISPEEQAYIRKVFRQYGIADPPQFDEIVPSYAL
ncbi:MAG: DUF6078 family protein [Mediterranea sp.]|nr:DUF6078 family protein [Mediterranea sp.]